MDQKRGSTGVIIEIVPPLVKDARNGQSLVSISNPFNTGDSHLLVYLNKLIIQSLIRRSDLIKILSENHQNS